MLMNLKPWLCSDPGQEFDSAAQFGNLRLGEKRLFWKSGLRRYAVELSAVRRVWRQEENVYGKLCCGGRSYVIHRLVPVRKTAQTPKGYPRKWAKIKKEPL